MNVKVANLHSLIVKRKQVDIKFQIIRLGNGINASESKDNEFEIDGSIVRVLREEINDQLLTKAIIYRCCPSEWKRKRGSYKSKKAVLANSTQEVSAVEHDKELSQLALLKRFS